MRQDEADSPSVDQGEYAEPDLFKEKVTSLLRSEFGDRSSPLMERDTVRSLLERHFRCSSGVMGELVAEGKVIELQAGDRHWTVCSIYPDQLEPEQEKYADRSEVRRFAERYDISVNEHSPVKSCWWVFTEDILEVPWRAVKEGYSYVKAVYVDEPLSDGLYGRQIECTIPSEIEFDRWKTDVHERLSGGPEAGRGL